MKILFYFSFVIGLCLSSCSPISLPPPNSIDLVGEWKTTQFQMGSRDVNAYISLAFYGNQTFSFKLDIPVGGDLIEPYKWHGNWSINSAGGLELVYDADTGFMGMMSQVEEVQEKFILHLRNDVLQLKTDFYDVDFGLKLNRAE